MRDHARGHGQEQAAGGYRAIAWAAVTDRDPGGGEASSVAGIDEVRRWIDTAERVAVLTGAGISTDSGIPDFRGPQGVWTRDPEAEKASDISYYVNDPEVRRRSWQMRLRNHGRKIAPNAGHDALAGLERRGKLSMLITQNVDGLHQAAGTDPDKVIEIHGTMTRVVCLSCDDRHSIEYALDRVRAGDPDPACEVCGGILKSDVISFGQPLVEADLRRAEAGAMSADLLLAVGTTLTVYPIAAVPDLAQAAGARVVIVNAEPTPFDHRADAVLRGSISEILPAIIAADPVDS